MPWPVLSEIERLRQRRRQLGSRVPGSCHDTIDGVMRQASAVMRRRTSEDDGTVAVVIANTPHCVPCIALVTGLDARRIYAAIERLKANASARLVTTQCRQCHRQTTAHVIGE